MPAARIRTVLASLAAVTALTALGVVVETRAVPDAPSAAAAEQLPSPPPRASRAGVHDRWVLDPQGRVLVTHGINMVYKLKPYAPDVTGFGRDDARFLVRQGFTSVRLGLIWRAVEPRPGVYDDRYLARVRRTAQILADEGLWVLLDFHQDLYHERFQGEGAPTWAVVDDGVPAEPAVGFPNNYFVNLGLNRAYDNFWANVPASDGVGLQDHYAAAWAHVAQFFSSTPRILGLDLFNEPWPGTLYATCVPAGCPLLDARLEAFQQKVIDAVRAVDRRTTIYYEPYVLFNNGVATTVRPHGRRLGFSFHNYCLVTDVQPVCDPFDTVVWANLERHVAATGHPPLLTEFGATTNLDRLHSVVDTAAEHRTGWQYWAYCGCGDPTTEGEGNGEEQALVYDPAKPPVGENVDWDKLRAVVTPHPLMVAGTPEEWRFDRGTEVFTARWSTERAGAEGRYDAGAVSTVFLPRHTYGDDYRVTVEGGRVVSGAGQRVLRVAQRAGATTVTVTVTPAG
ncbi:cellulase family glycosylhydrolase [Nocardioides stalactiti]|uniref:cellulase family glycosylhydrolase n=1 Tax=Nocardioides stalactiti TaxID=2755356 RepID=UPI00160380E7|nr:cellulase family glycosylhydrolase [Nocardioides stalactiti]